MSEPRMLAVSISREWIERTPGKFSPVWMARAETADASAEWKVWGETIPLMVDQLVTVVALGNYAAVYLVQLAAGEATEARFLVPELLPAPPAAPEAAAGTKCPACFGSGYIAGRVCNICAGSGAHA